MTDMECAVKRLREEDYTCVLYGRGGYRTSRLRGVKPLLDWIDSGEDTEGFSAADRVVGNGAAYLYVLLKVRAVYAEVMSVSAKETLTRYGIEAFAGTEVPAIRNRTNTGGCPMEEAVSGVSGPEEALAAIRKRLAELAKVKNRPKE